MHELRKGSEDQDAYIEQLRERLAQKTEYLDDLQLGSGIPDNERERSMMMDSPEKTRHDFTDNA